MSEGDDIQKLSEALRKAREEKARLEAELNSLRGSLREERRHLKKIVVTGLYDDRRLAREALKKSGADPLSQAVGVAERQASNAVSRVANRVKPEVLEFIGDVVDGAVTVSLQGPSPMDRFWVYVKAVHDLRKGQVSYAYAAQLTVAALKELPNDFQIPSKPAWWKYPG